MFCAILLAQLPPAQAGRQDLIGDECDSLIPAKPPREAIERKVEGSFLIRFSVATDGKVSEVKVEQVTDGIEPLAKLWADSIRRWTFVKTGQPVSSVEYRRIYLYPKDETKQHDDRVH